MTSGGMLLGLVGMIRETRVLPEGPLRKRFPDGEYYRERRFGFEKSYSVYRLFAPRG